MPDLTEFLLARIAEKEVDVQARKTYAVGHTARCIFEGGYEGSGSCDCGAVDRVLAECAAKRQIVEAYQSADTSGVDYELGFGLDLAVKILATIWADHPDFQEAWRP